MPRPAAVLFMCLFASQAALLVLSPTLPEIASEFGVSTAAAGQLRSISGAAGGVTAVLLAIAPRRAGLRELLSWGAGLVALGSVATAAAPSFAVLAAAQGVLGAGIGLLVAVGIAAAREWAGPEERAHVLAWAIVGMPAAWIAGMPVVGAVTGAGWRVAWLTVPVAAALAALVLLRLRPADPPTRRSDAAVLWRSGDVARFTLGELLANAAWAGVLTYTGALVLESYDVSTAVVGVGLGAGAAAMVPGTFAGRRGAAGATPLRLARLTAFQGGAVLVLGAARPAVALTLALFAVMAFVNGRRTMIASSLGMDTAPEDALAVMAMRAGANQFGYLLGAAAGGVALAGGGFAALGAAFSALFLLAVLIHVPVRWTRPRAALRPATAPSG